MTQWNVHQGTCDLTAYNRHATPQLSGKPWSQVEQAIIDGMTELAKWEKRQLELQIPVRVYVSSGTPRIVVAESRVGTQVNLCHR